MADVAALGYEIDASGVVRAARDLDGMSAASKRADDAAKKLSQTMKREISSGGEIERMSTAFENLRTSVDSGYASAQKWQSVQTQVARAVELGITSQREANIVLDQARAKYLGIPTAAQKAAQAQEEAARAARDQNQAMESARASVDQLRMSYDPLFAASKRYEAGVETLNNALRLGVMTQADYDRALDRMGNSFLTAAGQAEVYGNAMRNSTAHTTNLMFQFQDIGMMLAAGQSPLMLAMQQGTQVAGVFQQMKNSGQSAFSGIIGGLRALISPMALLTVGTIAGGAALVQWGLSALGASDDAKTAEDALDDLISSLNKYEGFAEAANKSTIELREEFGRFAEEARRHAEFMQGVALADALSQASAAITPMREELMGVTDLIALAGTELNKLNDLRAKGASEIDIQSQQELYDILIEQAQRLASDMGLTVGQVDELNRALADAASAQGMDAIRASSDRVLTILTEITRRTGQLPPELRSVAFAMEEVHRNALNAVAAEEDAVAASARWEAGMARVYVEVQAIASLIASLGGGAIDAAAKRTELAALKAGKSVADAARAAAEWKRNMEMDAQVENLSAQYGVAGRVLGTLLKGQAEYNAQLDTQLDKEREIAKEREKAAAGVGGGGGGGSGLMPGFTDERLRSLLESLRTEREVVDQWYAEQQAILADRRAMELLGVEGHNEAKLRLEREYQERLSGLRRGYHGTALDQTQTFMGDMANALANGNEKMARIGQVFASVEALINAYRAYNQVLADPSLPWFAKIPAAISVLAAGMKTVQSIKSMSGSSGSGRTSASSATASGTSAQAEPERLAVVELRGPEWIQNLVQPMMSEIYEQTRDGTRVIFRNGN